MNSVTFDQFGILKQTCLHTACRLLRQIFENNVVEQLEFEYRYRRYLAEFGEADSDLVVSTFSKSGTTWMQLILYQLTTQGDMNFDHLFDVSPWVWYSAVRTIPPERTAEPRVLKSHDDYRRFKKGRRGRFVFVTRDGRDVCISLFHHRKNFKRYEGTFEEHFDDFLNGTEYNWFDHTQLWVANAYGLPIHYVRFEDLKARFDETVRGVADFIEIQVDDDIMSRTTDRCSFASMKRHELQLGPRNAHFSHVSSSPYFVKNPDQFIRRGEVGEGLATLSDIQLAAYRERFDRSLGTFPLLASYR
jgi:hypothetical protein